MAYLMASGEWRCEGWTYCDRGTEKNGRDWIASKPLWISCPLPYWLDHVASHLMFLSLVSFAFELVVACHALVSLACLFEGRET